MPSSNAIGAIAPMMIALLVTGCVTTPEPPALPATIPSPSSAPSAASPQPSGPSLAETPSAISALHVQIVYPAGAFTKVRAGLRTQSEVPPEDLTADDLERLQIQLDGKDLTGFSILRLAYDASSNLVVTLSVPVAARPAVGSTLRIALPSEGVVMYAPIQLASTGRVNVDVASTANALLDTALQAVMPAMIVSAADRELLLPLVQRRVFRTLTSSGSGNVDRSPAMQALLRRITMAISQGTDLTVDNLKAIETPPATTGGNPMPVPATIEQLLGGSTANYGTNQGAGQSITAPVSGTLRAFDLWLGGGATVTISVYRVDGTGLPMGTALAEKPGIVLSGTPTQIQVVFDTPAPVTANAKYAVVATVTAGTMTLNHSSTNQYDGGTGLHHAGGPWFASATSDIKFVAYFN